MSADTAKPEANTETELKLRVTPQVLSKLKQTTSLWGKGGGRAVTRDLASVYFDTADGRLQAREATLRVRKSGTRFIQTLKSAAIEPGGLTRGEWEWPVTDTQPDLSVVVEPEALSLLDAVCRDELAPVFESRVKRTIRLVESDESTVEVAFDSGELRTGAGAVTPLSEVELELKRGDPGALFALALEIAKVVPVRLETRSKAARGFALAAGISDETSSKAMKLALSHEMTVEGALNAILRNGIAHMGANETCALAGDDSEGVHQMRVALRRLRSAVNLFRPFIPGDRHVWLADELKWLANGLGPARDWDVFLSDLLEPVSKGLGTATPLGRDIDALREAARARQTAAYGEARDTILSERYTRFVLELSAWVETKGWRAQPVSEDSVRLFAPIGELADSLLDKRMRRARKIGRHFEELHTEQRHQLRIGLKKLRYAADFFRGLYDEKRTKRFFADMSALQDALGHLNDVATASRLIGELHAGDSGTESRAPEAQTAEARAAGLVVGWHARGLAESEAALVAAWRNFADSKPFWSKPTEMG